MKRNHFFVFSIEWQHCIIFHLINGQMSMFQYCCERVCAYIEYAMAACNVCVCGRSHPAAYACILGVSIRRPICHCMCICVRVSIASVFDTKTLFKVASKRTRKRLSPLVFVCCISQHLLHFFQSKIKKRYNKTEILLEKKIINIFFLL